MSEPTVVVGEIAKAHGVRGEVVVAVRSDNPERFAGGAVVYLQDGRALTVESSRPHASRLLVRFEGVADRTAAEGLRGSTLVVPISMLPELPDGEYWPHQLEGCEVVTESGRVLGRISDVVANPANDLWVTLDDAGRETLVPAIHEVVVEVDVGRGHVLVRDVRGLTVPAREARR
jgi:16S rRNA processing protein RimM